MNPNPLDILPRFFFPHFSPASTRCARLHRATAALAVALACGGAAAHGDVTPQAVDTAGLPKLGDAWRAENPFRQNAAAVKIGTSAYNQNCARCHGLEAISGGIAPMATMRPSAMYRSSCRSVWLAGSTRRPFWMWIFMVVLSSLPA